MIEQPSVVARLLDLANAYVTRQPGTYALDTPLPRLTIWSSTRPTLPTPSMFEPMFYAVLQRKRALTIGGSRFELLPGTCAATSFGLPFIGQLTNATSASPYVSIRLDLDVDLLTDVMLDMPKTEDRWVCSAAGGSLEGALADACIRFVGLLEAPDDRMVLGRNYEAELYYRLLQSTMGNTLRQLGRRDSRSRRIKVAADWLSTNMDKPIVISDLAASVGMSLTSFHRHFKAVTGYSPLAFQRQIRLLEARRLLIAGGISVSQVAYSIGYASPAQFSREYKGLFGTPPATDLARLDKGSAA